jgi:hypothetical protein
MPGHLGHETPRGPGHPSHESSQGLGHLGGRVNPSNTKYLGVPELKSDHS